MFVKKVLSSTYQIYKRVTKSFKDYIAREGVIGCLISYDGVYTLLFFFFFPPFFL
jgi:hypothetical protein